VDFGADKVLFISMTDQMPKVRSDLIIQEVVNDDGSKNYIIKDPITNAFFKIGEPEYYLISGFNGLSTPPAMASPLYSVIINDKAIENKTRATKTLENANLV